MFQYDMLARSIVAGNGYRWYAQADLPLCIRYLGSGVHPNAKRIITDGVIIYRLHHAAFTDPCRVPFPFGDFTFPGYSSRILLDQ
jgi:hypothetical protein